MLQLKNNCSFWSSEHYWKFPYPYGINMHDLQNYYLPIQFTILIFISDWCNLQLAVDLLNPPAPPPPNPPHWLRKITNHKWITLLNIYFFSLWKFKVFEKFNYFLGDCFQTNRLYWTVWDSCQLLYSDLYSQSSIENFTYLQIKEKIFCPYINMS